MVCYSLAYIDIVNQLRKVGKQKVNNQMKTATLPSSALALLTLSHSSLAVSASTLPPFPRCAVSLSSSPPPLPACLPASRSRSLALARALSLSPSLAQQQWRQLHCSCKSSRTLLCERGGMGRVQTALNSRARAQHSTADSSEL